jgi:DNA-binding MarR family transcriptional regulator
MSEVPKKVLSTLMILGAQSSEKAISTGDLAAKLGIEKRVLDMELNSLVLDGYIVVHKLLGSKRVYLTPTGIITASSAYS